MTDVDAPEIEPLSLPDHCVEADRARDLPSGYHFFHVAHDEIHDRPLCAEQVTERRDHHVLHGSPRDHLLEHVREVLQNHDRLGTGVLQLVLELARGVQRIDVDHDIAGTQDPEDAHGVLQTVRHHHRDPRAPSEPLSLKPSAEGTRQALELSEADRPAHVGVGRAVAVLSGIALEQLSDRAVLAVLDLGRNARRVMLEPDSVHASPLCRAFCQALSNRGRRATSAPNLP